MREAPRSALPTPAPPRGTRGYAICTVGRTGSTWFTALLGSTGVLGKPGELFNTPLQRYLVGPGYPVNRVAQARFALDECSTPNGVYGLKVMPLHVAALDGALRWTQALPNLRFIHWRRRDLLGLALSRHRANQTNQWYSTARVHREAVYGGPGILGEIRRATRQDGRWQMFFARTGIEPLRLVYEDAMGDPQATIDAVADFLGLDERPVIDLSRIKLEKQRDATTDEWRARFLAEYGDPDVMDEI